MAAYAALVSLMNDLELISNHPTHSFSFDVKQITPLSQTVNFLIDFMETYDSHGCSRESVEVLESQIANRVHKAHDVIESNLVDQIHAGSTLGGKTTSYFMPDLHMATQKMEFIKRKAIQFKLKSVVKAAPTSSEPLTSRKKVTMGFDAVVVQLMEMLTGEPSNQLSVISVEGMGGIGKTTLARNVYGLSYKEYHFDVCLWATISHEYSVDNILNQFLSNETKSTTGGNVSGLGEELHKKLWCRRYLVVLDDMWSEDAWNEIRMFLPDNGNGSRVVVTTRLSILAARLSFSPFEMKFMDDDKSWELFCGNAFGGEDCPIELKEIGKKIVKRCRGLPLSIVVIGGHLGRSSRAIEYWEIFANLMNPISSIGEDDQCLKIISLSYDYLPAWLKPCFIYMGIFKEDEGVDASNLYQLWIAEGFLKPKEGLSMEEVAEDFLEDLVDRNLVLVRTWRWNGKIESCYIHDIVRELCLKVAKKEKFLSMFDATQPIGRERRIVVGEYEKLSSPNLVNALKSAEQLRSIVNQGAGCLFTNELPVEFRLLRVWARTKHKLLSEKDGDYFPRARLQRVNLRYLSLDASLRCCHAPTLLIASRPCHIPTPYCWNLQTFILMNVTLQMGAPYAPHAIWGMPQLRYVKFVIPCVLPDPLPYTKSYQQECIVLENLHALLGVMNLRLTEEFCKRMPNLKKLVVIYHFGLVGSNCCLHNFGRFNKLTSLKCTFMGISKRRDIVISSTFPSSLEELALHGSPLYWEDLTMMIKSLPRLGFLELNSIQGSELMRRNSLA